VEDGLDVVAVRIENERAVVVAAVLGTHTRRPIVRPAVADRPSTEGASETRRAVERFSARPLVFLTQLPRWALLLVVLGLLVSGFAVPGPIGAVLLVLVAILLGWLAYLSWPSLNTSGRAARVVALVCMIVIVVWQARR